MTAAPEWLEVVHRLPEIRRAYHAKVEELAEKLRPQFEAGAFRWYPDDGRGGVDAAPVEALEAACAEAFGLVGPTADTVAGLICSLSPETAAGVEAEEYFEPAEGARQVVAYDVLSCARARGWSVPVAGEVLLIDSDAEEEAQAALAAGTWTPPAWPPVEAGARR